MLTPRQERILSKVVEDYLHTGQPVSSRVLAADPDLDCGPSTVRNELAQLEEIGLLDHPHVSAGRVPTDAGQRYIVDRLLQSGGALAAPRRRLELTVIRREVDEAMRSISETLSQMTNLLAVVSAPSINTATIRHVEVLELQPQLVLVVIITSAGEVSKMLASFDRAVDPGLVAWAGEYLNERLFGLGVGSRTLGQRLLDPSLSPVELAFLGRIAPAFTELAASGEEALYLDGTARLFETGGIVEAHRVNELIELLERRVALLRVLRSALSEPGVYVRIGARTNSPRCIRWRWLRPATGSPAAGSAPSRSSAPCGWTMRAPSPRFVTPPHELSRFVEDAYAEN